MRIRTLPDGDVTETEHEFVSRNAAIWNLPHFTPEWKDAWAVYIPLVGRPTYYVSIVFKSPGPDPAQLAEGDGPGYVAAVDVPEREHGGDSPFDGVVHITEHVGATWSGHATVGVDVEVMSFAQQAPTGETIRIESVTFHSLPVE
ncbi:MAG: hypothetical protein QNJ97_24890 [Myxococcota bacterium]|nr:hypothetical protein [Myxococcota bacterium]